MKTWTVHALGMLACVTLACGDDGSATDGAASDSGDASDSSDSGAGSDSADTTEGTAGSAGTGSGSEGATTDGGATTGAPVEPVMCGDAPPPGAQLAPALPTYGGTCPALEVGWDPDAGEAVNVLPVMVDGGETMDRRFAVIVPDDIGADEVLPVIFMWHWLGGDAKDFYERSEVQEATNYHRFIAVIPESGGDLLFQWPFSIIDPDARMEVEFQFFDDMLACVAEQFPVDKECVSSTGVSAGALWTAQLAGGRGERLSSIISLSGGVGGGTVKPWTPSPHKMPALVLWGGPDDFCVAVDFEQTSIELENALVQDNHAILECIHNCEHATPPFDAGGPTTFSPMWMFMLDHPYWLEDGESWYRELGLPMGTPEWCAMGAGNATPRTGECGGSEC